MKKIIPLFLALLLFSGCAAEKLTPVINEDFKLSAIYKTGDFAISKPDGNIVFQSRADGQIKHMGYRIETGEIERAVLSYDKIVAAVCFFDRKADRIICIYEGDCSEGEILAHIKNIIPKYMFPNKFMKVDKMIYNANGKTDRPALEKLYYEKSE